MVFINPESIEESQDFIVKSKLTRDQIPFAVVADPERVFPKRFGLEKATEKQVEVRPSMIIIDRNGVIRFKYIGMDPYDRPPTVHLEEILKVVNGS